MSSQAHRHTKTIVGENIKAAREVKKLTQRQVAGALGMDAMAVSRWERGKVLPDPVATMPRLADVLGVEIGWLYTDHERSAA